MTSLTGQQERDGKMTSVGIEIKLTGEASKLPPEALYEPTLKEIRQEVCASPGPLIVWFDSEDSYDLNGIEEYITNRVPT